MICLPRAIIPFNLAGAAFGLSVGHGRLVHHRQRRSSAHDVHGLAMMGGGGDGSDTSTPPSPSQAELDVLQLAQSHFAAQALTAVLQIGVLDAMERSRASTVDEIIAKIHQRQGASNINRDALFRCLRLLCTSGVVEETTKDVVGGGESAFLLSEMGELLQQQESSAFAAFPLHWAELPIWNAWAELPGYVAGSSHDIDIDRPPFDRANGMSASDYYRNYPESCRHRNAVARYASSREIPAILHALKSSVALSKPTLKGKTIVDVGGGYGDLMHALKMAVPSVGECYCLDLPDVIEDARSNINECDGDVTLVSGNMFDASTIPKCDVIVTKHVLCDFSDEDVVRALQSFREAMSNDGKVVIMDAVLPNGDELNGWNPAVSFDVLLMLTGRRGERSRLQWSNLAKGAGFALKDVLPTSAVTVDLAVLSIE